MAHPNVIEIDRPSDLLLSAYDCIKHKFTVNDAIVSEGSKADIEISLQFNPSDGATIHINDEVFTFVNNLTGDSREVEIGNSTSSTATNFFDLLMMNYYIKKNFDLSRLGFTGLKLEAKKIGNDYVIDSYSEPANLITTSSNSNIFLLNHNVKSNYKVKACLMIWENSIWCPVDEFVRDLKIKSTNKDNTGLVNYVDFTLNGKLRKIPENKYPDFCNSGAFLNNKTIAYKIGIVNISGEEPKHNFYDETLPTRWYIAGRNKDERKRLLPFYNGACYGGILQPMNYISDDVKLCCDTPLFLSYYLPSFDFQKWDAKFSLVINTVSGYTLTVPDFINIDSSNGSNILVIPSGPFNLGLCEAKIIDENFKCTLNDCAQLSGGSIQQYDCVSFNIPKVTYDSTIEFTKRLFLPEQTYIITINLESFSSFDGGKIYVVAKSTLADDIILGEIESNGIHELIFDLTGINNSYHSICIYTHGEGNEDGYAIAEIKSVIAEIKPIEVYCQVDRVDFQHTASETGEIHNNIMPIPDDTNKYFIYRNNKILMPELDYVQTGNISNLTYPTYQGDKFIALGFPDVSVIRSQILISNYTMRIRVPDSFIHISTEQLMVTRNGWTLTPVHDYNVVNGYIELEFVLQPYIDRVELISFSDAIVGRADITNRLSPSTSMFPDSLTFPDQESKILVWKNGLLLSNGLDYGIFPDNTDNTKNNFVFNYPLADEDVLHVMTIDCLMTYSGEDLIAESYSIGGSITVGDVTKKEYQYQPINIDIVCCDKSDCTETFVYRNDLNEYDTIRLNCIVNETVKIEHEQAYECGGCNDALAGVKSIGGTADLQKRLVVPVDSENREQFRQFIKSTTRIRTTDGFPQSITIENGEFTDFQKDSKFTNIELLINISDGLLVLDN